MYKNPRECSLGWPEYCRKTCAMLRELCPSFPPSVPCSGPSSPLCPPARDGLGNEEGSLLQDCRLCVPCSWPALTEGGFCRINNSWPRSPRARAHSSCSYRVEGCATLAVRNVMVGLMMGPGSCSSAAVPLPL